MYSSSAPEVTPLQALVRQDLAARAFHRLPACDEDHSAVCDPDRLLRVFLDQKDRDAEVPDCEHSAEQFLDHFRREGRGWLVEQEYTRTGHERPPDREHL